MDQERQDYADHKPLPRWVTPSNVLLVVVVGLSVSLIPIFYFVLPALIPGFIVD